MVQFSNVSVTKEILYKDEIDIEVIYEKEKIKGLYAYTFKTTAYKITPYSKYAADELKKLYNDCNSTFEANVTTILDRK